MDKTAQDEINNLEWQNPENWGGIKFLGLYFSKEDSRLLVPKRNPAMGWTLNLGHQLALFWLFGIFGFFFILGLFFAGGVTYILLKSSFIL